MISYTSQKQLSLDLFKHPFERNLDPQNRWVLLASLVPWDSLASIYCRKLSSTSGRKTVDVRIVLAAIIIKHKLQLDDRGVILAIQENIYLQYFCGLKSFTTEPVFDPSLFVNIRKRLGKQEFDAFNQLVIDKSEQIKDGRSRIKKISKTEDNDKPDSLDSNQPSNNKGILKVDATVADQEITYPNDVKLLNECRENLERMIDLLYDCKLDKKKPRTYRRVARKDFLDFTKKKRKSKKLIRTNLRKQLQYVKRDIGFVDVFLNKDVLMRQLNKRDSKLFITIQHIYQQQEEMYRSNTHSCDSRIVNLYQPHVRPMPRGKEKAKTEFGAKIDVSLVNGFSRLDRLEWETYNESKDLKLQLENYYQTYGCYPATYLGDKIYITRANRSILKDLNIKHYGPQLGRAPKKEDSATRYRNRKKAAQRNLIEGKFGQGKRAYGLNKIRAKLKDTSESWISAIIFVMNLEALLAIASRVHYFFVLFLKVIIDTYEILGFRILGKRQKEIKLYISCGF